MLESLIYCAYRIGDCGKGILYTGWNQMELRVKETMQDARIVNILRIQNRWLWERYTIHRKRMQLKNSGVVNKLELFHGTRGHDPKLIYEREEGFDVWFSERGK